MELATMPEKHTNASTRNLPALPQPPLQAHLDADVGAASHPLSLSALIMDVEATADPSQARRPPRAARTLHESPECTTRLAPQCRG